MKVKRSGLKVRFLYGVYIRYNMVAAVKQSPAASTPAPASLFRLVLYHRKIPLIGKTISAAPATSYMKAQMS